MTEIVCGPGCSGWTLGWKGGAQDKHPAAFCAYGGEGAVIIPATLDGPTPPGCPRNEPILLGHRKRRVIYVAGPYRAATPRGIVENIRRAEAVAIECWRKGWAVICPHLNTALFDGLLPDEAWIRGDLEIMARCDALVLVEGWENSSGAKLEIEAAKKSALIIYWSIAEVAYSDYYKSMVRKG